jgi:hypothetical protein
MLAEAALAGSSAWPRRSAAVRQVAGPAHIRITGACRIRSTQTQDLALGPQCRSRQMGVASDERWRFRCPWT